MKDPSREHCDAWRACGLLTRGPGLPPTSRSRRVDGGELPLWNVLTRLTSIALAYLWLPPLLSRFRTGLPLQFFLSGFYSFSQWCCSSWIKVKNQGPQTPTTTKVEGVGCVFLSRFPAKDPGSHVRGGTPEPSKHR